MPRHFGIDVVEQRLDRNLRKGFGAVDGHRKLGQELAVEFRVVAVGSLPQDRQVASKTLDRILGRFARAVFTVGWRPALLSLKLGLTYRYDNKREGIVGWNPARGRQHRRVLSMTPRSFAPSALEGF